MAMPALSAVSAAKSTMRLLCSNLGKWQHLQKTQGGLQSASASSCSSSYSTPSPLLRTSPPHSSLSSTSLRTSHDVILQRMSMSTIRTTTATTTTATSATAPLTPTPAARQTPTGKQSTVNAASVGRAQPQARVQAQAHQPPPQQAQQQQQSSAILQQHHHAAAASAAAVNATSSLTSDTTLPSAVNKMSSSSRLAPPEDSLCPDLPLVFDTHKLVTYLHASGLSPSEAEAITGAMVRISQQASRHHVNSMVTKSEFSALRSELSILEKADFALLKTDINSIEKRLDTSVAEIYTAVERVENRVIKWVIAVAGAIGLGIIRLMSTSGSGSSSSSSGGNVGSSHVPRPPTANITYEEHSALNAQTHAQAHQQLHEVNDGVVGSRCDNDNGGNQENSGVGQEQSGHGSGVQVGQRSQRVEVIHT